MTTLLGVGLVLIWALLALTGWFALQLFRQNGRILLRVEALERDVADLASESDAPAFGTRALDKSRLNRNGLSPGTKAPGFTLPALDGRDVSLEDFRGRRLLLVFSDPECGPCQALAEQLERVSRWVRDVSVLMVSRGDLDLNRRKAAEHGLTFPIVLQRHWEISREYAKFATPIAYLIDELGVIEVPLAAGAEPILSLLSSAAKPLAVRTASGQTR